MNSNLEFESLGVVGDHTSGDRMITAIDGHDDGVTEESETTNESLALIDDPGANVLSGMEEKGTDRRGSGFDVEKIHKPCVPRSWPG